ncbi:MAG: PilZ domain-containing protein [Candidatus Omnitrophota bacterium]
MKHEKEKHGGAAKTSSVLRQVTKSEDFVERRKTARLDVAIRVEYKVLGVHDSAKGTVAKDISTGGCLLVASEDIAPGSDVELQILLGDSESEALRLKGKIVRLNRKEGGVYEYGISFDALSSEARRLFADYFFAKMYEMIGLPEWPTYKKKKNSS